MRIYLKHNPANIHTDPIWNGALDFFEEPSPNKNIKMSSDSSWSKKYSKRTYKL